MAKISVEFDTSEKTLSCSIDGKAVDNVSYVTLGKDYWSDEGKFTCNITTMMEDEEKDMKVYTQLCASESVDAKKYEHDSVQSAHASFVERKLPDEVTISIRECFSH